MHYSKFRGKAQALTGQKLKVKISSELQRRQGQECVVKF